jgi:hypothetical protein
MQQEEKRGKKQSAVPNTATCGAVGTRRPERFFPVGLVTFTKGSRPRPKRTGTWTAVHSHSQSARS